MATNSLGEMKVEKIVLVKNGIGLGFTIQGGRGVHYVGNDPGIFVSSVKQKGAAAKDGRLKEGDKILKINGKDVRSVVHEEAVEIFHKSGNRVELLVDRGARQRMQRLSLPMTSNQQSEPSLIINRRKYVLLPLSSIVLILLAVPLSYFMYKYRMFRYFRFR